MVTIDQDVGVVLCIAEDALLELDACPLEVLMSACVVLLKASVQRAAETGLKKELENL